MREIKFRIWGGQKMEYSVVAGALGNFYAAGIDSNDSASLGNTTKYTDQAPIMQFTGLLDKNGVEIYEGDILQTKYFKTENPEDFRWQVLWGSEAVTTERITGWIVRAENCDYPLDDSICAGEIIGNIYENSDLLN